MTTVIDPDHGTDELKLALAAIDLHGEGGKQLAANRAGTCKGCFHCKELQEVLNALSVATAAETDARTAYRGVLYVLATMVAEHLGVSDDDARQVLLYERNRAVDSGEVKEVLMKLAQFFRGKGLKDDEPTEDTAN